ncbi:MAG: hypothetical protein QW051_04200, partial [Candidatus Aenigmatarchaeota archaeon]
VEFYVDGITGEVAFSEGEEVYWSKGIDTLLKLSKNQSKILIFLLQSKESTLEKISRELKLSLSDVKSDLSQLAEKKFIAFEKDKCHPIIDFKLPLDVERMKIERKIIEAEREGETLDFTISSDIAKKIAELFDIHPIEVKPVYYPYWIITHKKKKYLINALTNKLEIDKSKIIKGVSQF